ncbi:MAG TPA: hypothetical protein VFW04_09955 [Gemmatimonadaceae bacterium]|nr:hypothetical protein [Gemmatimonadaceae bacterium]
MPATTQAPGKLFVEWDSIQRAFHTGDRRANGNHSERESRHAGDRSCTNNRIGVSRRV